MKKHLLATVAALALATPAMAHNSAGDLVCEITDQGGNALTYSFANNTEDDPNVDSGVMTGTYVETTFSWNGRLKASAEGTRPVWRHISSPADDNEVIELQDAPGWSLVRENISYTLGGQSHSTVRLVHNGATVGSGVCNRDTHGSNFQPAAPSAPRIPDESAN